MTQTRAQTRVIYPMQVIDLPDTRDLPKTSDLPGC